MIAANEAVATFGGILGLSGARRARPGQAGRLPHLFARAWGSTCPRRPTATPSCLRDFLDEVRQTPLAPMVQLMLLRSLKQARYAGENLGHYGLATDWYTHFTSPIRRYPDLWCTAC
jgi:ribonuclease R